MNQATSVKSARRVLQILNDFAGKRRPQRAAEVARAIDAPISSCVALLGTMVEEGVLFYDETARTYVPTTKLRELSEWIVDVNPLEKRAIYFAKRLYRELGTPMAVTRRAGLYVEWLYVLGAVRPAPGELRPLCRTINGRAVLSHMSDADVREFVCAHNERFGRENYIDLGSLLDRVRAARAAGYASGDAPLVPGFGAICFAIEDDDCGEEVLLTVEVPAAELRLREARIVDAARRLIPDLGSRRGGSISLQPRHGNSHM
jgi:IclR family KDG regulon transcriptional repressor